MAQQKYYSKYWVQFTDKANNGFTTDRPWEYLSQRSIDRRAKSGIPIEKTDLPVTQAYVDSLVGLGFAIHNKSKWLNAAVIETEPNADIATLAKLPFVKQVIPVEQMEVQDWQEDTWESMIASQLVFSDEDYGTALNQIAMLNGDYLHELGYMGEDMHVAVLDAGFNKVDELLVFEKLFYDRQVAATWDFVNNIEEVYSNSTHGMAVLSCMAGYAPGYIIGTAPNATYYLFRTEKGSTEYTAEEDYWVAAIEMADSMGIDVVNSSLGYSGFSDTTMDYTYADMDGKTARITQAADLAARKGILVVTSAGNQGSNPWRYITAPADADSVLTVGAVDPNGNIASFSSRGPTADGRIKPNVVTQGQSTIVATVQGGLQAGNGTSFAAPVMAGAATCLWQAFPDKSNMEIIAALEQSASLADNPNDSLGYGVPDLFKAFDALAKDNDSPLFQTQALPLAYPNPFIDELNVMVYTEEPEAITLEVFDMVGHLLLSTQRLVEADRYSNFDLSILSSLQAGMYFIRVDTKKGNDLIKVWKQ